MVRLRPCTDKCNRKEGLTMATAQKKSAGKRRATSGGKRTNGTRSGSKSRSAPSRKNSSGAVPIRREVGAGACLLLASSDLTVTEAAYRCGFNDSSYFGKVFRKYKGISPKQYQLQNARKPLS